jgi:ribose-phosphate pyrophosphokinase
MNLQLFALNATRQLGQRIAECLHVALASHEEREFEDGEHKARPLESVRGRDVYVVHSLYGDREQSANDKLVRLLFFAGTLKDAGAQRVTAVVPYLCYARKDRRTKPRDPVTSRYVAALFESVGVDRVVTLDVHNLAAYENAFRIRAEHLEARPLLVDYVATQLGSEPIAVVSPDVGGVKRAEAFREALEERLGRRLERAFMEKKRSEGVVSGDLLVGRVAGCDVVIVDDLVSSGTTLRRAVNACTANGARRIHAAATHGLFTAKAADLFADPALESLVVADTVPPFRLGGEVVRGKLHVVDSAPFIAEAIRRMHTDRSLTELAHGTGGLGRIQEARWALS